MEQGLPFFKGMLAFCVLTVLLLIAGIESKPGPSSNKQFMATLNDISADFQHDLKEVKNGLEGVKTEVDDVKPACECLKESCRDLKSSTDNNCTKINELEQQIDEMEIMLETDRDDLDSLPCY